MRGNATGKARPERKTKCPDIQRKNRSLPCLPGFVPVADQADRCARLDLLPHGGCHRLVGAAAEYDRIAHQHEEMTSLREEIKLLRERLTVLEKEVQDLHGKT